MIITADYHTHTNYSHGKGTPEENVLAAMRGLIFFMACAETGWPGCGAKWMRWPGAMQMRSRC